MTAFLLDVNVLIALLWHAHERHLAAQHLFDRNSQKGWATCPFTQAAFVTIVANPAFSSDAVTPQEAVKLLGSNFRIVPLELLQRATKAQADEFDGASAT